MAPARRTGLRGLGARLGRLLRCHGDAALRPRGAARGSVPRASRDPPTRGLRMPGAERRLRRPVSTALVSAARPRHVRPAPALLAASPVTRPFLTTSIWLTVWVVGSLVLTLEKSCRLARQTESTEQTPESLWPPCCAASPPKAPRGGWSWRCHQLLSSCTTSFQ